MSKAEAVEDLGLAANQATDAIEIVPAILRATFEKIEEDWAKVYELTNHVQIDITDGVFAGDGTFRHVSWFKQLPASEKIELHMMVHHPIYYLDDVIDLSPARCVFHIEAFTGKDDVTEVYERLRKETSAEVALAINPDTPSERLEEYVPLLDYILFMGYNAGIGGQPIDYKVFRKIGAWKDKHPELPIAVDGHVAKDTVEDYVKAGARILCSNSAILKGGDPAENIEQLKLLAEAALDD